MREEEERGCGVLEDSSNIRGWCWLEWKCVCWFGFVLIWQVLFAIVLRSQGATNGR